MQESISNKYCMFQRYLRITSNNMLNTCLLKIFSTTNQSSSHLLFLTMSRIHIFLWYLLNWSQVVLMSSGKSGCGCSFFFFPQHWLNNLKNNNYKETHRLGNTFDLPKHIKQFNVNSWHYYLPLQWQQNKVLVQPEKSKWDKSLSTEN